MDNYVIDVTQVEELQTLSDVQELEKIMSKAKTAIVNGAEVHLVRKEKNGRSQPFDTLDTLEQLAQYKKQVFKYL